MAKGKFTIGGLTNQEHQAAMAAIKLVRGNKIKNAYLEGWSDGYYQGVGKYRGELIDGDLASWEKSQAKALDEPGDAQP